MICSLFRHKPEISRNKPSLSSSSSEQATSHSISQDKETFLSILVTLRDNELSIKREKYKGSLKRVSGNINDITYNDIAYN